VAIMTPNVLAIALLLVPVTNLHDATITVIMTVAARLRALKTSPPTLPQLVLAPALELRLHPCPPLLLMDGPYRLPPNNLHLSHASSPPPTTFRLSTPNPSLQSQLL
jgi:hypothetical protein